MGAENQKQLPKEPEKTMKCKDDLINRTGQRIYQVNPEDEERIWPIKV